MALVTIHRVSSNAIGSKRFCDAVRKRGNARLSASASSRDYNRKQESAEAGSFLLDGVGPTGLLRRLAPKRLWWHGGSHRNLLWEECELRGVRLGMAGGFSVSGEVRLVGGMLWH